MSRTVSIPARALNVRSALQVALIATLSFILLACSSDETSAPPPPQVVAQVVVEPGNYAIKVGDTYTFSARVLDANGEEIEGRQVTWSSTSQNIATVSNDGVVTALGVGATSIRATVGDKSGQAALTVSLQPVNSVELNQGQVTLFVGDSQTLTATARDAAGRVITGREVAWLSSAPSVVTVDAVGRLTAVNIGISMVSATIEGRVAQAMVTVSPAPVASVAVSPAAFIVEIGEQRQMSAIIKDARGNVLTGRSVQWSVDTPALIISPSGLITGARNGYVTITATSEGVSSSVGATIVAPEPYDYDLVYYWVNGTGSSELFMLDLTAGNAPSRLNAGNVSRSPTASPNGQRIAFAVSMQELGTNEWIHDIFAVDRNGMNMKRLTSATGYDESPEWSPTGGKIAYQRYDGARSDIWVMNEDGSAQVSLTSDMPAGPFRSAPSWSRDGQRIAFAQSESGPTGTTASIWIMNADGSNKRQLTSTLTGFDAAPTWSPDGTRIAFTRYYSADEDITIINIGTGALTRIPLEGLEMNPAWSPDGDLIAFTRNNGVYTMAPDGTRVRLRTVDPTWGGGIAPTWITRQ